MDYAQHAYWLMKTQDRQSLVANPLARTGTQGLRRPRFPFFVSQCQRAGGRAAETTLPNPQWKQILHLESTTAEASPETVPVKLRFCPKNRAAALNPARLRAARALVRCKHPLSPCQGAANPSTLISLFSLIVAMKPHSCPNAPPLSLC